jgi:hypothetical protein
VAKLGLLALNLSIDYYNLLIMRTNLPLVIVTIWQILSIEILNQPGKVGQVLVKEEVMKGNHQIICNSNNNSSNSLTRTKEESLKDNPA